ncbi:MAG: hypothetical protein H7145_18765 [Akkermansiaceae bacterium]|nr:hypothetical protein [Armatimonadota bacterium]
MDRQNLPVVWTPRLVPLAPSGVVARGAVVATALANRLLSRTDDQLAELAGVQAPGLLIVLSDDPTLLPWAEGAVYLGRDASAPSLLLPTTHAPSVPLPVLERAIRARFPELSVPLAVLPGGKTVVSVSECRKPMVRATLQAWKDANP